MTVNLFDTYNHIKKKKKVQSIRESLNSTEAMKSIFKPNQIINGRYKVIKEIGSGVFGVVIKAID